MDELMSDCIAETREMLDAIAGEIVAWEADPGDRGRLDAIFRFVHTVKGSCGFLDMPRLAKLSHAAEDVLAEVRAGRRSPDAALVSAVLAVIDRIGEVAAAIEAGESLDDGEDHRLVAALQPGGGIDALAPRDPAQRGPARSIRLPVELLDQLMSGLSDLVRARDDLALELRGAGGDTFERLSARVDRLGEAVARTRTQRLDHLFSALPRMVRDLAADLGREVSLELEGGEIELDREMIEAIRDPLTHIIRNAIDHGIEPPPIRRAAGKPAVGLLRIAARQSGTHIVIEAVDDGAGIDRDKVVARAVEAGLVPATQAAALSRGSMLALVFAPGLSTATEVTAISGRGVGMDVVRANVERIGGTVEIESRSGAGTRLAIRLPLTASTHRASHPARTCLVVDDSKVIRKVARHILEEFDFVVDEAADGSEALARCHAACPDVVLLDWNMPVMTGIEFLGALRRATGLPHRPKIVFCTTESDALQVRTAIDAGADQYLMKPFDRATLRSKLELVGVA